MEQIEVTATAEPLGNTQVRSHRSRALDMAIDVGLWLCVASVANGVGMLLAAIWQTWKYRNAL